MKDENGKPTEVWRQRIPVPLLKAIRKLADRERRPINNLIILILEDGLKVREKNV